MVTNWSRISRNAPVSRTTERHAKSLKPLRYGIIKHIATFGDTKVREFEFRWRSNLQIDSAQTTRHDSAQAPEMRGAPRGLSGYKSRCRKALLSTKGPDRVPTVIGGIERMSFRVPPSLVQIA
jgi:hypothetical protein